MTFRVAEHDVDPTILLTTFRRVVGADRVGVTESFRPDLIRTTCTTFPAQVRRRRVGRGSVLRLLAASWSVTLQVHQHAHAALDVLRGYGDDLLADAMKFQIDAYVAYGQIADAQRLDADG